MSLEIVVDLETTGRRSPGTHIVEVGLVVLEGGIEIGSFGSLSNPGEEAVKAANPEAMAVNGITPEMLKGASPEREVAKNLNGVLDRHWGAILISYNVEFDLWFLARPPWSVAARRWGECIMLAAFAIMEKAGVLEPHAYFKKPKWPKLDEAARFFGIPHPGSHRALDDARTAARIRLEILRRREKEAAQVEVEHLLDSGL